MTKKPSSNSPADTPEAAATDAADSTEALAEAEGNEEPERLVLSAECTKKIAERFGKKGKDTDSEIKPSLLSAEDIDLYVKKTGLIGPYYEGGGKKGRLKKAAYEGRIGTIAYRFNEQGELIDCPLNGRLKVPKNSIVFVECDLDFRLPEFIALRFNLQIKHVHRGLLLGTGPLVDPGYWGKLCIPLHNLTDEDYEINLDDGLIWVEFTKTTSRLEEGQEPKGRPPLDKEFWNIKDFIEKAQGDVDDAGRKTPIRSSIGGVVYDALASSQSAAVSAGEAQKAAARTRNIGLLAGSVTLITVSIGLYQLWAQFVSVIDNQNGQIRAHISTLEGNLTNSRLEIQELHNHRSHLEAELARLGVQNIELGKRIQALSRQTEVPSIGSELVAE